MPKSKTQAEKQRERDERARENEEKQRQEKEARALEFQKVLQEQPKVIPEDPKPLSNKDLRKQKKQGVQPSNSTSKIQNDLAANIFNVKITALEKSLEKTREEAITDAKHEASSTSAEPARVVQNHSTYCEGLKPFLIRLQKHLPGCTIIPGEISQGKTHCEQFELRFQRMINEHTYKFVARNDRTSQDVSINTSNPQIFTQELICETIEKIIADKAESTETKKTSGDIPFGSYNRELHNARQTLWKEQHQAKHEQQKERETESNRQKEIDKQRRKLATKKVDPKILDQIAERDVDIKFGENRGKYSMT